MKTGNTKKSLRERARNAALELAVSAGIVGAVGGFMACGVMSMPKVHYHGAIDGKDVTFYTTCFGRNMLNVSDKLTGHWAEYYDYNNDLKVDEVITRNNEGWNRYTHCCKLDRSALEEKQIEFDECMSKISEEKGKD